MSEERAVEVPIATWRTVRGDLSAAAGDGSTSRAARGLGLAAFALLAAVSVTFLEGAPLVAALLVSAAAGLLGSWGWDGALQRRRIRAVVRPLRDVLVPQVIPAADDADLTRLLVIGSTWVVPHHVSVEEGQRSVRVRCDVDATPDDFPDYPRHLPPVPWGGP